jgi:hypothetical protein
VAVAGRTAEGGNTAPGAGCRSIAGHSLRRRNSARLCGET